MVRNTLPRRFGAPGLPELNASQVCFHRSFISFLVNFFLKRCLLLFCPIIYDNFEKVYMLFDLVPLSCFAYESLLSCPVLSVN